jgi:hypothetical protein
VRLLPDSHGTPERLDPLGVALVSGGIVAIVWALVRANQSGWASAEIVSCLLGGAVLLLAFAAWEQHVSEPMLPLRLFRSRAFAAGNATTFLMTGAIFAAGFLVTQEFQLARGYSPVSAGVRLLRFFATPVLISPIAGAVSDRIGRRPVIAASRAFGEFGTNQTRSFTPPTRAPGRQSRRFMAAVGAGHSLCCAR